MVVQKLTAQTVALDLWQFEATNIGRQRKGSATQRRGDKVHDGTTSIGSWRRRAVGEKVRCWHGPQARQGER